MTDDLPAVIAAIRGADHITAICHESPDGDTLGAALAVAIIAERLGKQAEVVAGDPIPPFLAFLPRVDRVRSEPQLEPDVAVIVDAGDLARTGSIAREHADWLKRATLVGSDDRAHALRRRRIYPYLRDRHRKLGNAAHPLTRIRTVTPIKLERH